MSSNYTSFNQHTPDISELIFVPVAHKKYNYFCNSNKCTKHANDATRVLIFEEVKLRYDTDCPNCGCSMFAKRSTKKDVVHE